MNEIYCSAEYAVTGATKAEIMQKRTSLVRHIFINGICNSYCYFHSPGFVGAKMKTDLSFWTKELFAALLIVFVISLMSTIFAGGGDIAVLIVYIV